MYEINSEVSFQMTNQWWAYTILNNIVVYETAETFQMWMKDYLT
jgi:hypothetical protein